MSFPYRFLLVAAFAMSALAACSNDDSPATPPTGNATDRYVNQASGDDANDGSQPSPWATISHAVATADTSVTIRVATGSYDAAHGETFPITLKKYQKLIGDTAKRGNGTTATLIQGEGVYSLGLLSGTTVVGANGSRVAGFSIAGVTGAAGYGEIFADGVIMEIDHNTFLDGTYCAIAAGNGANLNAHDNTLRTDSYGLFLDGSGIVHVHGNDVAGPSYGLRAVSIDSMLVEGNSFSAALAGVQGGFSGGKTTIKNNTFTKQPGDYGSIICVDGTPTIRGNTFTGETAVWINQGGAPDVGTALSPGNNNFSTVTGPAIKHGGVYAVTAIGNTWAHDPPTLGVDYLVTGSGSVITQ